MPLKIIFMGTPEFAVPILKSIQNSEHKILCVYTQPAKKKDRGLKINSSPIQIYCEKTGLQYRCPEELNNEELFYLESLKPDVVIVVAYGKIIPNQMLEKKEIQFINIHASLLPKWRGAAPIQRSLINLDQETGISIMKIIPKLDAGPIMMQSKIKIDSNSNYKNLYNKLSILSANKILDALKLIENKEEKFVPQIDQEATYAKKIEKIETKINWKESAETILAKIRAFNPTPGSWFDLDGSRIKVFKAAEVQKKGNPGEILSSEFVVACGKNAIKIIELKKEGKKKMAISEFLKGTKIKIGKNVNK